MSSLLPLLVETKFDPGRPASAMLSVPPCTPSVPATVVLPVAAGTLNLLVLTERSPATAAVPGRATRVGLRGAPRPPPVRVPCETATYPAVPCGPCAPVAPVTPCAPAAPVGPCEPAAPAGPTGPPDGP